MRTMPLPHAKYSNCAQTVLTAVPNALISLFLRQCMFPVRSLIYAHNLVTCVSEQMLKICR